MKSDNLNVKSEKQDLISESYKTHIIFDMFDRALKLSDKILAHLSSIIEMGMVLLITGDVTGRYLFHQPILGSDEIVGLTYVSLAACCIIRAQISKGHIRIQIVIDRLSLKSQLAFDAFAYLFALVISGLISWRLFEGASRYILNLQAGSDATQILRIPFYPFWIFLGLGFAILALVLLRDAAISIMRVIRE